MESRYGYNSMNLFSQMGYPAMASMGGMPNMAGYGTGYTATGTGTQSGPNPGQGGGGGGGGGGGNKYNKHNQKHNQHNQHNQNNNAQNQQNTYGGGGYNPVASAYAANGGYGTYDQSTSAAAYAGASQDYSKMYGNSYNMSTFSNQNYMNSMDVMYPNMGNTAQPNSRAGFNTMGAAPGSLNNMGTMPNMTTMPGVGYGYGNTMGNMDDWATKQT